jgi:uncharacterized protein (DUF2141 family)
MALPNSAGLSRALLFAATLVIAPAVQASAGESVPSQATLIIRVEGLSPQGGMLRLGLYNEAAYPDDSAKPIASADIVANANEVVVTLDELPPGVYAVETFQDINNNGEMDRSWVGLPLEPFGFSRDARPLFAKPKFGAVKFDIGAGMNVQVIHLQNASPLIASK